MSGNEGKACSLWKDYLFVTRELDKFIIQDNVDMVLNLIDQRERLQAEIEKLDDDVYKVSPEGQKILLDIQKLNDHIVRQLEMLRNLLEKQQKVAVAYDGFRPEFVGNQMDQKG
ncbi:MAG: hypothetical protein H6Q75_1359 [Firmicutes bacterium]|nr:hypothetical protein [Bacillota bacterium]